MNINLVRSRFQKRIDFLIEYNYTEDISQMRYSLQQDTLTTSKIQLYITSSTNPNLVGQLITIKGQRYIVLDLLREPFNKDQWTYELLFSSETVHLTEVIAAKNAIGGSKQINPNGTTVEINGETINVINGDYPVYIKDSRKLDKEQLVNSADISFFMPRLSDIDIGKNYTITYDGITFKQKSLSVISGAVVLQASREH